MEQITVLFMPPLFIQGLLTNFWLVFFVTLIIYSIIVLRLISRHADRQTRIQSALDLLNQYDAQQPDSRQDNLDDAEEQKNHRTTAFLESIHKEGIPSTILSQILKRWESISYSLSEVRYDDFVHFIDRSLKPYEFKYANYTRNLLLSGLAFTFLSMGFVFSMSSSSEESDFVKNILFPGAATAISSTLAAIVSSIILGILGFRFQKTLADFRERLTHFLIEDLAYTRETSGLEEKLENLQAYFDKLVQSTEKVSNHVSSITGIGNIAMEGLNKAIREFVKSTSEIETISNKVFQKDEDIKRERRALDNAITKLNASTKVLREVFTIESASLNNASTAITHLAESQQKAVDELNRAIVGLTKVMEIESKNTQEEHATTRLAIQETTNSLQLVVSTNKEFAEKLLHFETLSATDHAQTRAKLDEVVTVNKEIIDLHGQLALSIQNLNSIVEKEKELVTNEHEQVRAIMHNIEQQTKNLMENIEEKQEGLQKLLSEFASNAKTDAEVFRTKFIELIQANDTLNKLQEEIKIVMQGLKSAIIDDTSAKTKEFQATRDMLVGIKKTTEALQNEQNNLTTQSGKFIKEQQELMGEQFIQLKDQFEQIVSSMDQLRDTLQSNEQAFRQAIPNMNDQNLEEIEQSITELKATNERNQARLLSRPDTEGAAN